MDIHEYTLWEVGYSGSLQDIANILEYPQEQVLFSGSFERKYVYVTAKDYYIAGRVNLISCAVGLR